jgi:hypothetical protein
LSAWAAELGAATGSCKLGACLVRNRTRISATTIIAAPVQSRVVNASP